MAGEAIDRAFVDIIPRFEKFAAETKVGVDKAMGTLRTSVGAATTKVEEAATRSGTAIGTSAKHGASTAETHLSRMGTRAEKTFHHIRESGKEAFGALGGKGIVGLFAAAGVVEFGKKSVETFESVARESLGLQRVMGGSVEEASRWRGAMQLSGIGADQFQVSVKKLSQAIVAGSTGKGPLPAMGLAAKDATGHLRPMSDLMPEIADRFQKMAPGAAKNALAIQLFGRSGLQMLPFLNRGAEGMQKLKEKADEMGIVIGDKQAAAFKKSIATQREFHARIQGLQIVIGEKLIPAIDWMMETVSTKVIPVLRKGGAEFDRLKVPIGIIAALVFSTLVPALVVAGVQATISAVKQVAAWTLTKLKAIQSAAIQVTALGFVVVWWVKAATQSVVSAVRQAAAWALTKVSAVKSLAVQVAAFAVIVAKWVWSGVQAMLAAAKIAAAWLISIGPIALVILAVVGLTVLIVKNWDRIWRFTTRIWGDITGYIRSNWRTIVTILTGGLAALVFLVINKWATIRHTFNTAVDGIIWYLKHVPGWITNIFANALTWLAGAGYRILQGLYHGARDKWAELGVWISGRKKATLDKFSTAKTWLTGSGANILNGLCHGMSGVWDKIKKWIGGFPKSILHMLGINSPPAWAVDAGGHIMGGILKGIINKSGGALGFMGRWAKNAAKSAFGAVRGLFAGGGGGGASVPFTGNVDLMGWVSNALLLTGTPDSWLEPIMRRISFESGGNPNAINLTDINAQNGDPSRGLMQTIMSTFQAYHQPGTSGNIYDPVANVAAAINYIKSRYGSIFAIDPPVQGYRTGAWDLDRDQYAKVHAHEMIVPRGPADDIRRGNRAGNSVDSHAIAHAVAGALAGMAIRFDGDGLARLVTDRQDFAAQRGGRR